MAVGPEVLEERIKKDLNVFEELIDQQILGHKGFSTGKTINLTPPNGFRREHLDILKLRYIQAGWKSVEWMSDQREGEWLEFKS